MNHKNKTIVIAPALAVVLLVTALLVFRGTLATSALAASHSVEGVWIVTVTPPGGQPTFTNVTAFHGDGSVVAIESDGRPGMGVWRKVSDHRYTFTVWEYWKEGKVSFQAKLTSPIKLSKGGQEYSGPFSLQLFMVGNPNPIFEGEGTATGVRMPVR